MSGLVKELELRADKIEQLEYALKILFQWNSSSVGYSVETDEEGDLLRLHWAPSLGVIPFLTPITDTEALASIVGDWLSRRNWQTVKGKYNGDGDDNRGFYLTNSSDNHDYTVLCVVRPAWIYYSK